MENIFPAKDLLKEKRKMDRSNTDPFWNHIVKMDDGSMKCKFCGHPFARGTTISRIKWHLSGEKGRGVTICGQVPKEVQEAAFLAMRVGNKRQKTIAFQEVAWLAMGGSNQRKKTIASSSNVNDNAISSCPQEESNEAYNLAGDAGSIRMAAVQGTEQGVGEGRTTSCAEAGNHMENVAGEMRQINRVNTIEGLIGVAHETRQDARQIMEELSQVNVELAEHGEALSQQGEVYSPGTLQWMESLTCYTDFQLQLGCSSPERLVLDAPDTRPITEQMHPDCEGRTCCRCWRRPDVKCRKCKKMGHREKICRSNFQQNKAQVADQQEEEEQLFVATCFASSNSSENWLIDSGCCKKKKDE